MANTPWRRNSVKVQVDTGVEHTQSAAVPSAPGVGKGTYWVRNDSPTTPMFTDSSGSDHALGDTFGPASSTDHALARFDGITGKIIQNSTATLSDTGTLIGVLDIFIAGAEAGDAPADGDDVVIGDGTPDNHGLTFFTGPAAIGGVYFTDTAGTWQGAVTYNHTTNLLNLGAVSAVRAVVASTGIHPNTTNLVDLGTSTVLWRSIYLTNTAFVPNVRTLDATGASASSNLLVQPGLGGPTNGNGGSLTLSSGAPQGTGDPGDVNITGANAVSGNVEGGDINITAGASTGSSNGGDIVVKAGLGGSSGAGGTLTLDAGDGGGANAAGGWAYLRGGAPHGSGSPGRVIVLAGSAISGNTAGELVSVTGGDGSGTAAGGRVDLLGGTGGSSNGAGGDININGGGGDGSGAGGNVQVIGGTGGLTGNGGAAVLAGGTNSGASGAPGPAQVIGGSAIAASGQVGGPAILQGGAGNGAGQGGEVQITSGAGGASANAGDILISSGTPGAGGKVGRVVLDDLGLEFVEQSGVPGIAVPAGRGRMWVRDDANATTLMFTDDGNVNRPISKMPAITLSPRELYEDGATGPIRQQTTGGQEVLTFSASADEFTQGWFTMPETYNGGNLTLTIWFTGTTASTNNIRWLAAVERQVVGDSYNTNNAAAPVTCDAAGPSSARALRSASFTLTNANLDGAQPGDLIRFNFARAGADGADTYGGIAELASLQLREP